MSTSKQAQPRSDANTSPPVIRADEVYTLEEAARRMRWRKHSTRQALLAGLVTTKFGSRRYVVGQAVLDLMQKLAEQDTLRKRGWLPVEPDGGER